MIIESVTSLWAVMSVWISLKGEKLNFHAPIDGIINLIPTLKNQRVQMDWSFIEAWLSA